MEKYNQREKEIIKKIVEYKSNFENLMTLGKFLSEQIFAEDFHIITFPSQKVSLMYCKNEDKRKCTYFIAELSFLIQGLIKDGLLKFLPGNTTTPNYIGKIDNFDWKVENDMYYICINGKKTNEYLDLKNTCMWKDKNGNNKYALTTFPEESIHLIELLSFCPLVSPELEKMVKNNYKTIDQKTLCWTRVAAVVSILGMLVAVILPHFTTSKIDNTQYDGIIRSISKEKTIVHDTIIIEKPARTD